MNKKLMPFFFYFLLIGMIYAADNIAQGITLVKIKELELWEKPSLQYVQEIRRCDDDLEEDNIVDEDVDTLVKSSQLVNLERLDLSDTCTTDDHIRRIDENIQSFRRLNFIDLSRTHITLKSLEIIGESKKIGSLQSQFRSHSSGDPVAIVNITIDDTPAAKELVKGLEEKNLNLRFLYRDFHIDFIDSISSQQVAQSVDNGVKQLKILRDDETYTALPSPSYFDLGKKPYSISLEKAFKNQCSISDIRYNPSNFLNLLSALEGDVSVGRDKKTRMNNITRMAGYSGLNGVRDFETMKRMASRMSPQEQWDRIGLALKRNWGKSLTPPTSLEIPPQLVLGRLGFARLWPTTT